VVQQQLKLVPDDTRARGMLANSYAILGQRDAALREVEISLAMRPNDSTILYNCACIYGIFKDKKKALELLHRAAETGFPNLDWAARDPDLACLHDDAEFRDLLQKRAAAPA
jgi:Flp pilus assembly protein TadD